MADTQNKAIFVFTAVTICVSPVVLLHVILRHESGRGEIEDRSGLLEDMWQYIVPVAPMHHLVCLPASHLPRCREHCQEMKMRRPCSFKGLFLY